MKSGQTKKLLSKTLISKRIHVFLLLKTKTNKILFKVRLVLFSLYSYYYTVTQLIIVDISVVLSHYGMTKHFFS